VWPRVEEDEDEDDDDEMMMITMKRVVFLILLGVIVLRGVGIPVFYFLTTLLFFIMT
jgi:hypothetical protein